MNTQIVKENNDYIMTITYPISINDEEAFKWFSSNPEISTWFEELHFEEDNQRMILVFEMEDFREEMDVIEYRPEDKLIKIQWDQAVITFKVIDQQVIFTERIDSNYKNDYGDASNDLSGWAIHHERLSKLMNNLETPSIPSIHQKWVSKIKEMLEQL